MPKDIILSSNKSIGDTKPTFIIAEVGQNHQGNLNTAKILIETSKKCGADCVKFQKTCIGEKFNVDALEKPYTGKNSWGNTYGEHKTYLEFNDEEFLELQSYALNIGILFTASCMDSISLNFLENIEVPFIKIGSGDSNNLLLIEEAAKQNVPLIISTGMLDLEGVHLIYKCVTKYHNNFCLLHCVSSYPTPLEDINLQAITLLKNEFPDIHIGYSGHELGFEPTLAAVALGAKVVERHITLDKSQKGSDHVCSLVPNEFADMVNKIRIIEIALGKPCKNFQTSEMDCYQKLGKTLVAGNFLKKGHILTVNDIKIKVALPKGIDASHLNKVIGKQVIKDLKKDESVTIDCLKQ